MAQFILAATKMPEWVGIALTAALTVSATLIVNFWAEKNNRKSVVRKYRVFILYAAWSLQHRLYGIFHGERIKAFFDKDENDANTAYDKGEAIYKRKFDDVYATNIVNYTVFLFCQFFAWREIINRELHYFNPRRRKNFDSKVLDKLIEIEKWFSGYEYFKELLVKKDMNGKETMDYGDIKNFLIQTGEQRALGDLCICKNEVSNTWGCIGFSDFVQKWNRKEEKADNSFPCYMSVEKLEKDIRGLLADDNRKNNEKLIRLDRINRSLLELIMMLNPKEHLFDLRGRAESKRRFLFRKNRINEIFEDNKLIKIEKELC